MRFLVPSLLSLVTIARVIASDFDPIWAERLVGTWQSVAISGSGFGAATNAALRCHLARVNEAGQKEFEGEFKIRGADGRYSGLSGVRPLLASENFILIGSESRLGFAYLLTNSTLVLYGSKPDLNFRIELTRVNK